MSGVKELTKKLVNYLEIKKFLFIFKQLLLHSEISILLHC